tara:strand:- start:6441 stop:9968 length:3528 start_codon:yes stop_codon:yes gene_type:complete
MDHTFFKISSERILRVCTLIILSSALSGVGVAQERTDLKATSFTVTAPGAKTVRMHSNRFGWDTSHPAGIAEDNGDGTWTVVISPSWREEARYRWIIDEGKEYLLDDVTSGACDDRIDSGTVVTSENFAIRVWSANSGDVLNDVAGDCSVAGVEVAAVEGTLNAAEEFDAAVVEEDLDEIMVYGIRQSLETALQEKRYTTNLTEIINAEDIGKLPDENIAEVLENIAGVQVERVMGIGSKVSIRGIAQNRVEIDGRGTTPHSGARGGMSFTDLPAALVRSLNVVKVPTADMVEGSLGGTVNVKTHRGLKLKKPIRSMSVKMDYGELVDDWGQNLSLTLGERFETDIGDVGGVITLSRIEKPNRMDRARIGPSARRLDTGNPRTTFDIDGDGDNDTYFWPGYSEELYETEDRENTAINGSLAWQATPGRMYFAKFMYSDFARIGNNSVLAILPGATGRENTDISSATWYDAEIFGYTVPVIESAEFSSGTLANGRPDGVQRLRMRNTASRRDTSTYNFALGGEWSVSEMDVTFEVNGSGSDTEDPQLSMNMQYNDATNTANSRYQLGGSVKVPLFFDLTNGFPAYSAPLGAGVRNGSSSTERDIPLSTMLDPSYYTLFRHRDANNTFTNDLLVEKVDVEMMLDGSFWSGFSFGFRASQRSTEKERFARNSANFPFNSDVALRQDGASLSQLFPGIMAQAPGNFFGNDGAKSYLDKFLAPDTNVLIENRDAIADLLQLDNREAAYEESGYFKTEEDTYAVYVRGDFDTEIAGMPATGNVGVRYVRTEATSISKELGETFGSDKSYDNVLPSASLVLTPSWTDDIQLRFGYGSILRRPDFNDMANFLQYPTNWQNQINAGTVELDPITADQFDVAFEYYFAEGSVLSVGLFYKELDNVIGESRSDDDGNVQRACNPTIARDPATDAVSCISPDTLLDASGNTVAANDLRVFREIPVVREYEQLSSGIDAAGNPVLVFDSNGNPVYPGTLADLITPVNEPGGVIKGVEVGLTHSFKEAPAPFDGFGIIANYAYQEGDSDNVFEATGVMVGDPDYNNFNMRGLSMPFPGLSENSYNFTLFFEKPKYPVSGRIRYTFRDSFIGDGNEFCEAAYNSYPCFTGNRGLLTASITYRLNQMMSFNFSGSNLTDEIIAIPSHSPNGPLTLATYPGRRFQMGITVKL